MCLKTWVGPEGGGALVAGSSAGGSLSLLAELGSGLAFAPLCSPRHTQEVAGQGAVAEAEFCSSEGQSHL